METHSSSRLASLLMVLSLTAVTWPGGAAETGTSCTTTLVTDPTGDNAGQPGIQDLVAISAGDDASNWYVCFEVADFEDRPSQGALAGEDDTRFTIFWSAPYEGPGIAYSARAVYDEDGNFAGASYLKGAFGISAGALGGTLEAERAGNLVTIILPKSEIGTPSSGDRATEIGTRAGDDTQGNGNVHDRAPDAGSLTYTFAGSGDPGTPNRLFFHGDQVGVVASGNPQASDTYMDRTPPTATASKVFAKAPGVAGAFPGTVFGPSWTYEAGGLGIDEVDVAVTWYALVAGPSGATGTLLPTTWDIEVWVDDGDGSWTNTNQVPNAENPDLAAVVRTEIPVAAGRVTELSYTIEDVTAKVDPDGRFAVTVGQAFTDADGAAAFFYDSVDHPAGVTLTYPGQEDPLSADAGGPYAGTAGQPVAIAGVATGGDGAASCSWSTEHDGTFEDEAACATSVSFETEGTKALRLTVSDATGSATDEAVVTVEAPVAGTVEIASPSPAQELVPPFTFEGTFDTAPDELETASTTSGPTSSGAIVRLHEALAGFDGFETTSIRDDGTAVVYWGGAVPDDAPAQGPDGQDLRHRGYQEVRTLRGEDAGTMGTVVPVPEAVSRYEQSGPPTGPEAPRAHDGIGPGSALRMPGSICSAAYLVEDPTTGTYYLSTAGHCLVDDPDDPRPYTGPANPELVTPSVSICVMQCVANAPNLGQGIYVTLEASGDYHPVAFAQSGGIGSDFGLIEIPQELNGALRPWMPQWGGPEGFEPVGLGTLVTHYGHGSYCCTGVGAVASRVPADQGRLGLGTGGSQTAGFRFHGTVTGGDSGSGAGTGSFADERGAVGRGASGVITHLVAGTGQGAGINAGTDLRRGLELAEAFVGFRADLVVEDAEIRASRSAQTLSAEIVEPAAGALVDPDDTPVVSVSGTATFPLEPAPPGDRATTYWLHRDGCGTGADRQWMNTTNAGQDGGSGCGSLTDPVGFATSLLWGAGMTVYMFPADPSPAEPIWLDETRQVVADVFYSGFAGEPTVTDLEGILYYGSGGSDVVARGRASTVGGTHTSIPMAVETSTVPAGADLRFALVVHGSADLMFTRYGGDDGSRLTLPLAEAPERHVEVAVDDPGFGGDSLLNVTGTTTWSAVWDAAQAGFGEHTLYARAVQDGTAGPATSVTVSVGDVPVEPGANFTWSATGRTVGFEDTTVAGDAEVLSWSWDFGDGATSTEQHPVHAYDAFGTYTVTLAVTDEDGASSSVEHEVALVAPRWSVEVRVVDKYGVALHWVQLATAEDGEAGPWSFEWAPETVASGEHLLTARLLHEGAEIADDVVSFTVPNTAPQAEIDAPDRAETGTELTFDGSGSSDEVGRIVSWAWELGDGSLIEGETVTHAYSEPGRYDVTLTVTDDDGATDTAAVRHVAFGRPA